MNTPLIMKTSHNIVQTNTLKWGRKGVCEHVRGRFDISYLVDILRIVFNCRLNATNIGQKKAMPNLAFSISNWDE